MIIHLTFALKQSRLKTRGLLQSVDTKSLMAHYTYEQGISVQCLKTLFAEIGQRCIKNRVFFDCEHAFHDAPYVASYLPIFVLSACDLDKLCLVRTCVIVVKLKVSQGIKAIVVASGIFPRPPHRS